jgi:hypothetical protein
MNCFIGKKMSPARFAMCILWSSNEQNIAEFTKSSWTHCSLVLLDRGTGTSPRAVGATRHISLFTLDAHGWQQSCNSVAAKVFSAIIGAVADSAPPAARAAKKATSSCLKGKLVRVSGQSFSSQGISTGCAPLSCLLAFNLCQSARLASSTDKIAKIWRCFVFFFCFTLVSEND